MEITYNLNIRATTQREGSFMSFADSIMKPATLGRIGVKNRIIRSATCMAGADEKTGNPTPKLIEKYKELAKGGVGLIITGHAYVNSNGKASPRQLSISSDDNISGLANLVSEAHGTGCPMIVQISHAGAFSITAEDGVALAPSDVKNPMTGRPCKGMTISEIHSLITDFAKAAQRAKVSNADGVQLHLAHGFLLTQFLSPIFNKRKDGYGGEDILKRARIVFEILEEIRYRTGEDFPLWVKISVTEGANEGYSSLEGIRLAQELARVKVDAIEVSGGTFYGDKNLSPSRTGIIAGKNEGYFAEEASAISERVDKSTQVILVGGLRSQERMVNLFDRGTAEAFSLSRPLIAEPDLVNRWASGDGEPAECISCNACSRTAKAGIVYCPVMRDAAEGIWAPPPEC